MLLSADADPNLQNQNKQKDYCLHAAIQKGSKAMVKGLLQRGARLDRMDAQRNNPFNLAIRLRNFELLNSLLKILPRVGSVELHKIQKENYQGCSLMHSAVKHNQLDMLQRLLQANFDPNV